MNKKIPPVVIYMNEPREDKHKPRGHWTHWTANGTFELKSSTAAGSLIYELYFRGKFVARSFEIGTLIGNVLNGSLDAELGLPGATSKLPARPYDWNNL